MLLTLLNKEVREHLLTFRFAAALVTTLVLVLVSGVETRRLNLTLGMHHRGNFARHPRAVRFGDRRRWPRRPYFLLLAATLPRLPRQTTDH